MTDQEMTDGLKAGAPSAFQALYAAQGRSLLTYLARVTGRREMAEDLTQETFMTAIQKIDAYQSRAEGGLRAWLFRIATHRAIDALRREKRMDLVDESAEGWTSYETANVQERTPQDEMERSEFLLNFQKALMQLTPSQRMMFLLHEQENMSCLEISRVCGCSENAVKQGLFRARNSLRKILCE